MPDVEAELDALYETEPDTVALFDVLFDELVHNKEVLDVLSDPRYHHLFKPPFEIKRFGAMWRAGRMIYTMRVYDDQGALLNRRVLLGHHPQADIYYPLAFPSRDIAYETTDPSFRIVIDRYDAAGIPVYL